MIISLDRKVPGGYMKQERESVLSWTGVFAARAPPLRRRGVSFSRTRHHALTPRCNPLRRCCVATAVRRRTRDSSPNDELAVSLARFPRLTTGLGRASPPRTEAPASATSDTAPAARRNSKYRTSSLDEDTATRKSSATTATTARQSSTAA